MKKFFFSKSVNTDTIFDQVDQFSKLADRASGLCHLDSFASKLGLKLNEPVIKLFEIFDTEKSGSISLARFINNYFEFIYMKSKTENFNERVDSVLKVSKKKKILNNS